MEQDTVELMDPYRVLDPLANSDDDQPPYGRFAPSRRSQPPNLIPQSTADDSTSCSDFALEDSNEDDTFEFADNINNSVAVSNFNNSGMTHIDSGASGVIRKPAAHGRCAGCDALTVPKWRRDASGRRTLCDACGLKWCFGLAGPWDTDNAAKIGDFSDSVRATNDDRSSKEEAQVSPFNTTKNPSVPFLSSVSTPALTAKSLVSQQGLVEATDGDEQQQLQRLLDEARREDTATDRAFRRAVVRARRARTASASSTTDSIVSSASTASSGTLSAASESAVSSATAAAATAAAAATMASMLTTCRTDGTLSSFSTSKMPAGTIAAAAAPTAPPPSPLPPIPAMHPRVGSRDNAPSQDAAPTWSEDEDWTRHSVLSFINAVRGRQ
ncbi:hypothetical protein HK405_011495 [Cladochytrium tenue]|nr:hypothetical protein HK405_011495 [Cladochytrium tenue]